MRTIDWDAERNELVMIDQRLLPGRLELVRLHSAQETAQAIRDMTVRGAPAIGAAAAFGLALAAFQSNAPDVPSFKVEIQTAAGILRASRPTAVNLFWAIERMLRVMNDSSLPVDRMRERLVSEAQAIADEDVATNLRMAELGAELIEDGDTIIHHCNTGALATVDWGTALGCIRRAHEQGKRVHVLVDETRPRLQGARLTAWELQQYGIPYEIITDNMAGHFLRRGEVQKVFFGADRVAANGDVANKIGTYMLALAAHSNHVPVYAVAPSSTVDLNLATGAEIPIEERSPAEVLSIQFEGEQVTPSGAKARNPAFDVTPNELISAIVTEKGVIRSPYSLHLPRVLRG